MIYFEISAFAGMTTIYIFIGIFGLFIGSFLNVLADRLSKEQSIGGRSKCDKCKHVLSWYDLIPIISFTLLKGKCRYCRAPIAVGHLHSEVLTGVIFILTWYLSNQFYGLLQFHILHLVTASILVVMLLSDFRYQIIPDEMQIGLGITAIVKFFLLTINFYAPIIPQIVSMEFLYQFAQFIGGGIIVMLPLLVIFLITKGKGMGFGDVKLTFNIGLLLGLWNGLYALYIGFISGGLVGALILLTKRGKLKSKIAFGPFLIFGTYIVLFYAYEVGELLQRIYGF